MERRQQTSCWICVPVVIAAALCPTAAFAQEPTTTLSPQALREIAQVEAEIDRIEGETDRKSVV